MNSLEINNNTFENIKHMDENGNEFWYARDLMLVLEYTKWENFHKVIRKAMIACENSKYIVSDCFPEFRKPIISGKGRESFIIDYKLNRYACYLIAQNGDSRKEVIALAQTYFAIQTRKHELLEKEYSELNEDEKRLYMRKQARKGNYNLNLPTPEKSLKELEHERKKTY